MVRNNDLDRRTVLRGAAGVLTAGVLAGCSGSGGGGSNSSTATGGGSGGGTTDSGTSTADAGGSTDTGTTSAGSGNESATGGGSARVDQWLGDANSYNGSIADKTGTDSVEIAVGAGDRGFAFDPAAVRVSAGTTVRWAWTGRGNAHNVVAKNGAFDSGQPKSGGDITYEKTLDQSGTYLYYCEPHRRLGMKGAVVVSG